MYSNIHTHMYICIYICTYIYIYIYICTYIYLHINTYTFNFIHIYVYINILYLYLYTCIYTYTYINRCMYTYMYLHIICIYISIHHFICWCTLYELVHLPEMVRVPGNTSCRLQSAGTSTRKLSGTHAFTPLCGYSGVTTWLFLIFLFIGSLAHFE